MGAGTIALICLGIYALGFVFWWAIDGWIDYSEGDDEGTIVVSLLWPLFMWVIIGDSLKKKLKAARKKKLEREKQEERIRIATEKQLEKQLAELDAELDQEVMKPRRKRA